MCFTNLIMTFFTVSSSIIPGMTVAPGEAKVLVAKMPTIPPQLLGAQPSTGLTEAMQNNKLIGIILFINLFI